MKIISYILSASMILFLCGSSSAQMSPGGGPMVPFKSSTQDSGTVSPGLANQIAVYPSNGSTVSGLTNMPSAVLNTDGSSVPAFTPNPSISGTFTATEFDGMLIGIVGSIGSPHAGIFSSVQDIALGLGAVPFADSSGILSQSVNLNFNNGSGILSATGFTGALNGSLGNITPSTIVATDLKLNGSTSGQVDVKVQANAGSYAFALPTYSGSVGQPLVSDGGAGTGYNWVGTVVYSGADGGTANAHTIAAAGYVLTTGSIVTTVLTSSNTGATTVDVNGTGAKNVFIETPSGPSALVGGEMVSGNTVLLSYDGTQFQFLNPPSTTQTFIDDGPNGGTEFDIPIGTKTWMACAWGGGGGGGAGSSGVNANGGGAGGGGMYGCTSWVPYNGNLQYYLYGPAPGATTAGADGSDNGGVDLYTLSPLSGGGPSALYLHVLGGKGGLGGDSTSVGGNGGGYGVVMDSTNTPIRIDGSGNGIGSYSTTATSPNGEFGGGAGGNGGTGGSNGFGGGTSFHGGSAGGGGGSNLVAASGAGGNSGATNTLQIEGGGGQPGSAACTDGLNGLSQLTYFSGGQGGSGGGACATGASSGKGGDGGLPAGGGGGSGGSTAAVGKGGDGAAARLIIITR